MKNKPQIANIKTRNASLTIPSEALAGSFKKMIHAYFDYQKTCELERTRRAEIEAWRDTVITAINGYFGQIKQWSDDEHAEKMAIIQQIGNVLNSLAHQLPPECILELTKQLVSVVKTDMVSEKIKLMPPLSFTKNLNKSLNQDSLKRDSSDVIEI